jgi:RAB protein geranylgeranyltransferase component A
LEKLEYILKNPEGELEALIVEEREKLDAAEKSKNHKERVYKLLENYEIYDKYVYLAAHHVKYN